MFVPVDVKQSHGGASILHLQHTLGNKEATRILQMSKKTEDGGPLPNDIPAVRKAKALREVLLRYKAIYEGSKNTDFGAEHQNILEKRQRLDESMAPMLKKAEKYGGKSPAVKEYAQEELRLLAVLNKKPVTIEVTGTTLRIRARFQVRFEGAKEDETIGRFALLKRNFELGITKIWNRRLKGAVLPGWMFELIPELTPVSSSAPRDQNYWLITVRPKDWSPMVYGKTKLGDAAPGERISVTRPDIDGGVMSIPPLHITMPEILAHETLHLFGFVDRYFNISGGLGQIGLRDTQGRDDPLGGDDEEGKVKVKGKILEEDMGFLLDKFDIYPTMPYSEVVAKLKQVEEIIRTGRDPDSLINKRKDFTPEMVKQAEDLD